MKVLISVVLTAIMICVNINYLTIDSMAAAKSPSIKLATQYIKIGDKKKLTVTPSTPAITKNAKYTWKSSRRDIVSISKTGVITGISEGKSKITVETKYNKKTLKASCYVNVTELKSLEITAASLKKGTVSVKNDTFDSIIVKKEAGAAKINLSGVTVLNGIILEEGSESKIAATNSKMDFIEVEANSKEKQPSITLSKNSVVNECRLKGNANIVLKDKSAIKTMSVSPTEEQQLVLALNGFKGSLSLSGKKDVDFNVQLSNCSITDVDIISNNQPFVADFKNAQGSTIKKVQSDKWVNLKMGVPAELVIINAKNNLKVQSETTTAPAIKITGLEVYNKAVIQKVINYEEDMALAMDNGKIMEFITYANKTKVTMESAEGSIYNVIVNGNEANITGIGSIIYVKLNGNNSFVNVLETKVEADIGTNGNKAGQSNLGPMDTVIIKDLGNQNSSSGSSGSSSGGSSGGGNTNPPVDPNPPIDPPPIDPNPPIDPPPVDPEEPVDPPPVLPVKLDTPSNFRVKTGSDLKTYTISWGAVNTSMGYKVTILNTTTNTTELDQIINSTSFITPLSSAGVIYRIGVTAKGNTEGTLLDSDPGYYEITAGAAPTTKVTITDTIMEDVLSKAGDSSKQDVNYKLALKLRWKIEGDTPDSYKVNIKNLSSSAEKTIEAGNVENLRINQYITTPKTSYEIVVIPISRGVEGSPSGVYNYTSPASECGHTTEGCFIWKVDRGSSPVYGITTKEQMEHIRVHYGNSQLGTEVMFIQLNDIDFGGKIYNDDPNAPSNERSIDGSIIGNLEFTVEYDGQGFMIDNFTIKSRSNIVGVMGRVGNKGGTIKDFGVGKRAVIISTSPDANVGSITAYLYGNMYRCYSFATVTAQTNYTQGLTEKSVGGLAGAVMLSTRESYFAGSVTNNGTGHTGGIMGYAAGLTYANYNIGQVTNGRTGLTGGIAGFVESTGGPAGSINVSYNLNYPTGAVGVTGGIAGKATTAEKINRSLMVSTNSANYITGNGLYNTASCKAITKEVLGNSSSLTTLNSSSPSKPVFKVDTTRNRPILINNPERDLN